MIISSGITYRSIAAQNILSYSIDGSIDNTSGISSFGFSGDQGNLNLFTFKTGKIYDVNNRHVWSYNPSETFNISGNINTGNHNYYINNNIVCISSPKPNSYYKYFYVSSENSSIDIDTYTYGNKSPIYSLSFPSNSVIGNKITGDLSNLNSDVNLSIQFFTGNIIGQQYYSIENLFTGFISGQASGQIILNYSSEIDPNSFNSGSSNLDNLNISFVFQSNFGQQVIDFSIPISNTPFYFLDFVTVFTGISENFYNYIQEVRTKSSEDQLVEITLSAYSGYQNEEFVTGFFSTGLAVETLSGFIYGQDYLTGLSDSVVVSVDRDYDGNYLTNSFTDIVKTTQYATGLINYYYNLPVPGGSGLFSGVPGTFIISTGYANDITGNEFIYGSRSSITGSKSGLMTGYWYDFIQTGSGLMNILSNKSVYFTGQNSIDFENLSWKSTPFIGFDIENYNNDYKIYGITGSGSVSFTSLNNGVNTDQNTLYTNQGTGILVKYLFKLNNNVINDISGKVSASENIDGAINTFSQNGLDPWATNSNISTGFLAFEFQNFSPIDSGIISHYEIDLDKSFSNYKFLPQDFKLQGSNDLSNWIDIDSRTAVDFYKPFTNVFKVTGSALYNSVRLLITSGIQLPHINKAVSNNYQYGLSINKINFYKTINSAISGAFDNLIDNNQTSNYFYGSKTNSVDLIYRSINSGSGFSGLLPFNERGFSSINISLNNKIVVATSLDNSVVYLSKNTGVTWETGLNLSKDWTDSAISSDGSIISVTAYGDKIYTSRDSGVNWSSFSGVGNWVSVDMTHNGQYQAALLEAGFPPVYISKDSGISWQPSQTNFSPQPAGNTVWRNLKVSKENVQSKVYANFHKRECYFLVDRFYCYRISPQGTLCSRQYTGIPYFTGVPIFSCAISSDNGIWTNENLFEKVTGLQPSGYDYVSDRLLGYEYSTTQNPPFPPPLSNEIYIDSGSWRRISCWAGSPCENDGDNNSNNWASVASIQKSRYIRPPTQIECGDNRYLQETGLDRFYDSKVFAVYRDESVNISRQDYLYKYEFRVGGGDRWQNFYTQKNIYRYATSFPSGNFQAIISQSGIFTSVNTGITWNKETGNLNKLWAFPEDSYSNDPKNGPGLAISSGNNIIFATCQKEPDYLFSNQNGLEIFRITELDPSLLQLTGDFIGYKKTNNFNENSLITGFYISFENPNVPQKLIIEASTGEVNYQEFYRKNSNINSIESGFIEIPLIGSTGFEYFRFRFTDFEKRGFVSSSPICYSGWEENTGSFLNTWTSVAMTNNGQTQVAVGNSYSGELGIAEVGTGPYTGYLYLSTNYGNTWTGRRAITGEYTVNEVKFNSVALDNDFTGRFILLSRNGGDFNTGDYDNFVPNYNIYLSRDSGISFSPTGFNGAWRSVAMSKDATVMVAVGNYDSFTTNAQISTNTGVTWNQITNLNASSYSSVAINEYGNTIYAAEASNGYIWRSDNYGQDWQKLDDSLDAKSWASVATDGFGVSLLAVDGNVWQSDNFGLSLEQVPGIQGNNASMSIDGTHRIVVGNNNYYSQNNGVTWSGSSLPTNQNFRASSISSSGQYQLVGGGNTDGNTDSRLYSNCTFGNALPPPNEVIVKNANFYLFNQNSFYSYPLGNITGYGNTQFSISDTGTGLLFNPTGILFLPAVSYITGLLTGLIDNPFGGSFTWFDITVSGTGSSNNVYMDTVTGVINSTGLINFNTSALTNGDIVRINTTDFTYVTGSPASIYQFNTLSGFVSGLYTEATGSYLYASEVVGVTGRVFPNNSGVTLFSYFRAGESGNNIKLARFVDNINAIQIPHRYFRGGVSLRPVASVWTGIFETTFSSLESENSGFYTVNTEQSIDSSNFSGVSFRNSFYPNWSGDVTLMSEGNILNTGLTISLMPDINWINKQILTGTYTDNANLGTKVFIKNNVILASQPNSAFVSLGQGPVAFYTKNNNNVWSLGPNLTGVFGFTNPSSFGESMATWDGSVIVIGGPNDNNGTGSALVYTQSSPTGWILRSKLTGILDNSPSIPFGPGESRYGSSVAISSGSEVILTSSAYNNTGFGSTLIYTGNISVGWKLKQEIIGDSSFFYGQGLDVNANSNVIVLGGPGLSSDGKVNIFTGNKNNGWNFAQSITGENLGRYGSSVAINGSGSTIVIGGPTDGANGAILIYTGNQTSLWNFAQKISGDYSFFGEKVSISDEDIIAVDSNGLGNTTSIFAKVSDNTWDLKQKFIFNDDLIGNSHINNSGKNIVVGLPYLDSNIYTDVGGLIILESGLNKLTGSYVIPKGLSYLGYSGLNINYNKRYLNLYTNNIANYNIKIDGDVLFTGLLEG